MQSPDEKPSKVTIIRPKRLIRHTDHFAKSETWHQYRNVKQEDIATQPTAALPMLPTTPRPNLWEDMPETDPDANIPMDVFDIGSMSTMRLMEVSGMMRTVRPPTQGGYTQRSDTVPSAWHQADRGIGTDELFGRTHVLQAIAIPGEQAQKPTVWQVFLNNSTVRLVFGLLLGICMLFLVARFVDISTTVSLLMRHLTTVQGGIFSLLAAIFFIFAFTIRALRWRLFLQPVCKIKALTAIQIFWVAVFLNFLLPVQGGEVAKSLILKRIKQVPISKSLPTVAMDKSLDLMPALVLMAAVPFIPGIHMNATLWLVLSLVSSVLLGIFFTVALMSWNRVAATAFIRLMLKVLPRGIGGRIEGFVLGFVDSLLASASRPGTFLLALLLTAIAITCDGLFAWFAFLTVGVSTMSFGTAIFGYITYNMFSILPNPPGQVGSNELAGVLVFSGLLGFPKTGVLAMFVFSHPLAALIMTTLSMLCLSGLGISLKSVTK